MATYTQGLALLAFSGHPGHALGASHVEGGVVTHPVLDPPRVPRTGTCCSLT